MYHLKTHNQTPKEVHHHSHHPKSWKEYVQEFLMLFFAVFLGFMAEYYLEYRAERHKEHDYLVSINKDLKADLSEMDTKELRMPYFKRPFFPQKRPLGNLAMIE